MIKFEEHDDNLFLMLEEPVPLTPDAEMPCLTRLIQDNSRMGMFNRDTKPSRLSDHYLVARIVSNNIVVDDFMESDYHRFEIIGTLVEEGSKEWALYQMMQGKRVYNPCLEKHKSDKSDTRCLHAYSKFGQDVVVKNILTGVDSILGAANISHWMNYAEPTGWQIYKEPEPELQFKVGDWVEFIDAGGRNSQGKYLSKAYDHAILVRDTIYNMRCVVPTTKIIRKLKPSEIVVRIGCLRGTIRYCLSFDNDGAKHDAIKIFNSNGKSIAVIRLDALDKETRELVEDLLKAQEEE